MSEFGAKLRSAREEKGVSLRQIATATKISMGALEALERGELSKLPGGIFSRAFVRAYATEVGMDPEEAVRDFLVEFERTESKASEAAPPEVTADDREFLERQRKAASALRAGVIGVLVLIIAAIGYWQFHSRFAPVPGDAPASSVEAPRPEQGAPPSATPSAASVPASDEGPIGVSVEVTAACFLQVNADGAAEPIVSRVLSAGERHEFRADRELIVLVGSAGVVKWSINGRVAKPLGKIGERARVTITHANFKDFLQ